MSPADREWFLKESCQALLEADFIEDNAEKRQLLETGGRFLRAGMQEIWDQLDLMEGLGASPTAREKTMEMIINGEI